MSSVTVTENNNKVSVDKTTNVVTVTSPGTVGPQGSTGDSGTIESVSVTSSEVVVSGSGGSQSPTATLTLGGTAEARTMAFAFGIPTGTTGAGGTNGILSIVTTGTDGIEIDSGGTMNSSGANAIQLGINAQTLWTHILGADVTGTALTVSDGSNTSPIALEGTITYTAVTNETTVVEDAGAITIGLVDNPVVSGVTAGNVRVGVTADSEIDTSSGNLTLDSAGGTVAVDDNLTVAGNLTVSGTTTTIDSTITTIVDPIIVLQTVAGGGALLSDTDKDVGLLLQYHTGSANKTAFLGYDDSAGKLTFVLDASVSSEVISGSTGTMVVNIEGNVSGAVTGNASTATALQTARTIGGVSFDGTGNITLPGVNATGDQATTSNAATATALQTARTIGGVSFDGTGNITLPGVNSTGNQATSGNAATATALETARTIGGVSFDGTGNITLPGVNATGSQDTSGTATTATNVTVADESADTTCFPLFVTAATGGVPPKSGSNLTFNSSTGMLTATGFTGPLTGNASTASTASSATTATTATNVTVADESTDTECFPLFVTAASGGLPPRSGTNLTFNSGTGLLTATGFAGPITGAVTGNAATATALATGRTVGMTGDVVWTSPSFDGSGNVTASATIQANSVAMGTDTTGDYVATVTAGTGLTSTGATSGESIAHSLSVDAAQTQITSVGTIGTGVWQGTAVAQGYVADQAINEAKLQVSNAPTDGYVLTARSAATGDMTWEVAATAGDPAGSAIAMAIALG